jgi:hypothetical protein
VRTTLRRGTRRRVAEANAVDHWERTRFRAGRPSTGRPQRPVGTTTRQSPAPKSTIGGLSREDADDRPLREQAGASGVVEDRLAFLQFASRTATGGPREGARRPSVPAAPRRRGPRGIVTPQVERRPHGALDLDAQRERSASAGHAIHARFVPVASRAPPLAGSRSGLRPRRPAQRPASTALGVHEERGPPGRGTGRARGRCASGDDELRRDQDERARGSSSRRARRSPVDRHQDVAALPSTGPGAVFPSRRRRRPWALRAQREDRRRGRDAPAAALLRHRDARKTAEETLPQVTTSSAGRVSRARRRSISSTLPARPAVRATAVTDGRDVAHRPTGRSTWTRMPRRPAPSPSSGSEEQRRLPGARTRMTRLRGLGPGAYSRLRGSGRPRTYPQENVVAAVIRARGGHRWRADRHGRGRPVLAEIRPAIRPHSIASTLGRATASSLAGRG